MISRIELAAQVFHFISAQAPEPRRALRLALRQLERERGDVKALERELEGYFRLRVRGFRIVFAFKADSGGCRVIHCLCAERRNIVYDVFEEMLKKQFLSEGPDG